jgi:hypothetical protein
LKCERHAVHRLNGRNLLARAYSFLASKITRSVTYALVMPSSDQVTLSERLHFLHEFRYCDLNMPYQGSGVQSNKDSRSGDARSEIRILDIIAVLLTTGRPGDVTAVALDKRQGVCLVLAKNGPPTAQDDLAAQTLISVLTDHATIYPKHVFPFALAHCAENITKRRRNLYESLSQFLSDVSSILLQYQPQSIDEEFPNSLPYRRYVYGDQQPSIKVMISDLFHYCINESKNPLDPSDEPASHLTFANIDMGVRVLSRSRFLDTVIHDPLRMERAAKLKRRLHKVSQYYGGVATLITNAKRWFPTGTVPYRWATVLDGSEEGTVEISRVEEIVLRAPDMDITQGAMKLLEQKKPEMFQRWPRFAYPCIHAELRVILDLNPPSSTIVPPPGSSQERQKPIGCSKRSCLCCTLWISAFNRRLYKMWMTSGSHGKPYANWALPCAAYAVGRNGKSLVDEDVIKGVDLRLKDTLEWLELGRRISDEHRSSTDEESAEEEGYMAEWSNTRRYQP